MIEKLELKKCPFCGGTMKYMSHLDEKGLSKAVRDCVNTPYRKAKEISLYLPNYKCKRCYSVILPSYKGLNEFSKKNLKSVTVIEKLPKMSGDKKKKAIDDLKKLDGLPPYDDRSNTCLNDELFAKSLVTKYGMELARLRKASGYDILYRQWRDVRNSFIK